MVLSTEAEGRGEENPPRSAEFFISYESRNSIIVNYSFEIFSSLKLVNLLAAIFFVR